MKTLNAKVETMEWSLDRHEQYSRKKCFLIQVVEESDKENADEVIKIFEKEIR